MDRKCKYNPDRVCYIFGNVDLFNHQAKATDIVKGAYSDYFYVELVDQDKPFTLQVCCKTCEGVDILEVWQKEEHPIYHSISLVGRKI